MTHLLYCPFTGLGLYGGFRGNRWLRNRIQIFKQFVVPSLEAQTNQNFTLWVSWRPQERRNKQVKQLHTYLVDKFGEDRVAFTYGGVCFWDDKYSDKEAQERLATALHETMKDLTNYVSDGDVLMTIQPSDDCYREWAVDDLQDMLKKTDYQATGYTQGYIMNYKTKELREYNPTTNPPFFTIKFSKEDFIDPFAHMSHTGPYKSHEYIGDKLRYAKINSRGFLVGTHGENISTHFMHPFAGKKVDKEIEKEFGLELVPPLKIRYSWRKSLMRKLPHGWQRKLRYIFGEKLYNQFYKFIRN